MGRVFAIGLLTLFGCFSFGESNFTTAAQLGGCSCDASTAQPIQQLGDFVAVTILSQVSISFAAEPTAHHDQKAKAVGTFACYQVIVVVGSGVLSVDPQRSPFIGQLISSNSHFVLDDVRTSTFTSEDGSAHVIDSNTITLDLVGQPFLQNGNMYLPLAECIKPAN